MRAVLALALAGCGFSVSAGVGSDGGHDSSVDQPLDACVSFSAHLDTCGKPNGDLTITGTATLNTDTGTLTIGVNPLPITSAVVVTSTNQLEVRAVYVGKLTLTANAVLRAVGSRPLAIIATDVVSLQMGALIDVGAGGAGAPIACTPAPGKGEDDNGGAAGGGGGGFGAAGGKGGDGNKDGGPSNGGDAGMVVPVPLGPRGGCPGADGGDGNDPGGDGGLPGGAILIASAKSIELADMAAITAGGGGGGGGTKQNSTNGDAGGGGGGSGGLIWLEAPRVRSTGILAANGGGGGEGSGNGAAGNPGERGRASVMRAEGGKGSSPTGTDGGKGGAGAMTEGESGGGSQAGGGAGAGGGVGYIKVVSPDQALGMMGVSPAITP